jgi:hypothetical protein
MNTRLIVRAHDEFVITYITGINVKLAHGEMVAKDQSELVEILEGEGIPQQGILGALAQLREGQRSIINFKPKM